MHSSAKVPHLAWCEVHEKKAFTKKNAKKVNRLLPGREGMREYPCGYISGGWHTGHLPGIVRQGGKTAFEVYGPHAA